MGTAGLPGTGLGGLFYILLALWMPVRELYLTARGRGDRARLRFAMGQGLMALGIVAAVVLTVLVARAVAGGDRYAVGSVWLLLPLALLAALASVLALWARLRREPPRHRAEPAQTTDAAEERRRRELVGA